MKQRLTDRYLRSLGYDDEEIRCGFARSEQEYEERIDDGDAAWNGAL